MVVCCNCQSREVSKMSFIGWMNKQTVAKSDNVILSALKRNEISNHEKIWRNLKCILLCKRTQSEKVTYCVIEIIRHFGKGWTMETGKKIQRLPEAGRGEEQISRTQRIFRVVNLVCVIL
jgi:hypothetical protein